MRFLSQFSQSACALFLLLGLKAACAAPGPYFAELPNAFPDLTPYYFALGVNAEFSNNRVTIITVAAVDLNRDGRKDFLVHLHKNQDNANTFDQGPTPNRLVVFLQEPNGTFKDGTQSIFGSTNVDLGGASRKFAIADFNGDGYPDIAYAMNREDGRRSNAVDGSNNWTQQSVVMSNGNGTYRIDRLGVSGWGHSVAVAASGPGIYDLVFTSYNVGVEAFRYRGTAWISLSSFPDKLSADTLMFLPSASTPTLSDQAATEFKIFPPTGGPIASLYSRINAESAWSLSSMVQLGGTGIPAPFVAYNGDPGGVVSIVRLDGQDYVGGVIQETCLFVPRPAADPLVVHKWSTNLIPGGYRGGTVFQTNNIVYNKLTGFSTTAGQLSVVPLGIENEDGQQVYIFMDCDSTSGNSYGDIVVYPIRTGGKPIIYLNDGRGRLRQFDPTLVPSASPNFGQTTSMMVDLDGDGIKDLILRQTQTFIGRQPSVRFQLFKGIQLLNPLVSLGSPPVLRVNTTQTFAPQAVGISVTQAVTLTNSGGSALNIISMIASGDFAVTNNCGASVGEGSSCSMNVTFTPKATGSRSGSIVVTSNTVGSPHTISLSGTGINSAPPSAPMLTSVIAGSTSATIAFNPPFNNGGSTITSYTATCTSVGQTTRTATGTGSPLTVTGLVGGVVYSCLVSATNAGGSTSSTSQAMPVTPATGTPTTNPYTGLWWNAPANSESGWGMSLTQRGSILFMAWYTYDSSGAPVWYVITNCPVVGTSCTGDMFSVSGGVPVTVPWNSPTLSVLPVGRGTFAFSDGNNGVFTYMLNGVVGVKNITRQVFVPSGNPPAVDYTSLYWAAPANAESGWGVSLTQQFGIIFVALYTYDANRKPIWYVVTNCPVVGSGCTGQLFQVNGGRIPTDAWGTPTLNVQPVGNMTLSFTDANNGTMSFILNGVTGSKVITKQIF